MTRTLLALFVSLAALCAHAGTVSISVTESTQFSGLPTIDLTDSSDFVLWGAYPSGNPLAANYFGAGSLINRNMGDLTNGNPLRTMGQFTWHEPLYQVSLTEAYRGGVQHYPIPNDPTGEGFRLQVFPSETQDTVFSVYGTSWAGTGKIMAFGADYDPVIAYTSLDSRFKADFTVAAGGGPLLLQFTLNSVARPNEDANITISAAEALTVAAVPEPETLPMALLAGLPLFAIRRRSRG